MVCPKCGNEETKVLDSRVTDDSSAIRRRRECLSCTYRFTTFERREGSTFLVVKRDGSREPYSRDKLLDSLALSVAKRPLFRDQIAEYLKELEKEWGDDGGEVTSQKVGEDVLTLLSKHDEVAHIRFASVFLQFSTAQDFKDFIHRYELKKKNLLPNPGGKKTRTQQKLFNEEK